MKGILLVTVAFLLADSLAMAAEDRADAQRKQSECGWFTVLECFTSRADALEFNHQVEVGHTIETNKQEYPAFKPGQFCIVDGPVSFPKQSNGGGRSTQST